MSNTFFDSWDLWQKLVFILGLALVVTVLLGCAKLGYTHWRLRKYATVSEKEKQVHAVQRQMSQRRRTLATGKSDEVPFGIRAIESGVEVDGVWISRNNTPEPASRESSTNGVWDRLPRRQTLPDLERQDVNTGRNRSTSASSANTARHARPSFDRAVSAERMSSAQTSRGSSPDAVVAKPPRSRQPPCSYTRYSGNPYILRNSSTANTLEGIEAIYRASTSIHDRGTFDDSDGGNGGTGSSSHSSNGGMDIESIYASAPRLLTGLRSRTRQQSSDLNMLDNHRISQVAETGHITPRARRATQGQTTPPTINEQIDYFALRKASQPTPSDTTTMNSPKADALPESLRRSSMPDVTPFAQFVKNSPPSPSNSRPTSHASEILQSPAPAAIATTTIPTTTTTTPSNPPPPQIPPRSEKRRNSPTPSSQQQQQQQQQQQSARSSFDGPSRASQVVRGHGTGFEILRPGSLAVQQSATSNLADEMEGQRAFGAPPVSLWNGSSGSVGRRRSGSWEGGRKLRKKRRGSSGSESGVEFADGRLGGAVMG